MLRRKLLFFQFVPIAPCHGTGHQWKELVSVLSALSLQVFIDIDKILPESFLLQAEQYEHSAFPHRRGAPVALSSLWPSAQLYLVAPCLSCTQLEILLQIQPHQCWEEQKDQVSWPAGSTPPSTAHDAVGLCLWLTLDSLSPRSFFARLLSSLCKCRGFLLPRCRTLHFPLVNLMRFLTAHFCCLFSFL